MFANSQFFFFSGNETKQLILIGFKQKIFHLVNIIYEYLILIIIYLDVKMSF